MRDFFIQIGGFLSNSIVGKLFSRVFKVNLGNLKTEQNINNKGKVKVDVNINGAPTGSSVKTSTEGADSNVKMKNRGNSIPQSGYRYR